MKKKIYFKNNFINKKIKLVAVKVLEIKIKKHL